MNENSFLPARWVLREAAGGFWLVDTAQSGRPYRPPLRLNAAGAEIVAALRRGETPEQIASALARREGLPAEDALRDVREFCRALAAETGVCAQTEK